MNPSVANPRLDAASWLLAAGLAVANLEAAAPRGSIHAYEHRRWEHADELPDRKITGVSQDDWGYLWMSTFGGLVRFDGVQFSVFNRANTPAIRSDFMEAVCVTRGGAIAAATLDGLTVRDRDGGFRTFSQAEGLAHPVLASLFEDPAGWLWAGTVGGALYSFADGRMTRHAAGQPQSNEVIHAICERSGGGLWLASKLSGVIEWKGRILTSYGTDRGLPQAEVNSIVRDADGGVWGLCGDGSLFQIANGRVIPVPRNAPDVEELPGFRLYLDRKQILWVTGGRGIVRRYRAGSFLDVFRDSSLFAEAIGAVFEDRDGTVWLGTEGDGLHSLRVSGVAIISEADGLPSGHARCVQGDPTGAVWVGLEQGGLVRWQDGEMKKWSVHNGMSDDQVLALCQARDGSLWVGTRRGGVNRIRGNSIEIFDARIHPAFTDIRAILELRDGSMQIGTRSGGLLSREADGSGAWDSAQALAGVEIRCLFEDSEGRLWVGTEGRGLALREAGRWTFYGVQDGLPGNRIRSICEDGDGCLWIGLHSAGMARLRAGRFQAVGANAGLLGEDVMGIVLDRHQVLWLATNRGVTRCALADVHSFLAGEQSKAPFEDVGREENVRIAECNGGSQPTAVETIDGHVCFATKRGLVMVEPGRDTNSIGRVRIEKVLADRIAQPQAGPITFPPGSRTFEIHYTAPHFHAARRLNFKYRLLGIDKDWVDAGSRRVAYYSHLRPGGYSFEVQAASLDRRFVAASLPLQLKLLPHFYQTTSFASLVALIVAATLWLVHRARLQAIRRIERAESVSALEQERSRIAHEIHDDLGASLTQINLLSELVRREISNPDRAAGYVNSIAITSRQIFRALDEIVWAVNPRHDNLASLIDYLGRYGQDLVSPAGIQWRIDVPAEIPRTPLSAERRHHIFLAAKEAINNALKHARAREMWLRLSLEGQRIQVAVEDDGIGFDPSLAPQHRTGLDSMRRRMNTLGGFAQFYSQPGAGTRVVFTVPVVARPGSDSGTRPGLKSISAIMIPYWLLLALPPASASQDIVRDPSQPIAKSKVSFCHEIAPILAAKCANCHSANRPRGGYRLDTFDWLRRPGASKTPPLASGQPDQSYLFQLITTSDAEDRMPQKDDPLPASSLELIRVWIQQGA